MEKLLLNITQFISKFFILVIITICAFFGGALVNNGRVIYLYEIANFVDVTKNCCGVTGTQVNDVYKLYLSMGYLYALSYLWQLKVQKRSSKGMLGEYLDIIFIKWIPTNSILWFKAFFLNFLGSYKERVKQSIACKYYNTDQLNLFFSFYEKLSFLISKFALMYLYKIDKVSRMDGGHFYKL